jgi:hypothetical protein
MKLPKKFKINDKDFKIYFDNEKKTHVCENLDTGEKTNIGVIGILMQMGILKAIEDKTTEEKIMLLSDRIGNLENKIDDFIKNLDSNVSKKEVKEIPKEEVEPETKEELVEEKPKSEINERIMKNVLKNSEKKNTEKEIEEEPIEEKETEDSDVVVESSEEIDNWMKI